MEFIIKIIRKHPNSSAYKTLCGPHGNQERSSKLRITKELLNMLKNEGNDNNTD